MEPLLRHIFRKQTITRILLVFVGLFVAFSIQVFSQQQAISKQAPSSACLSTQTISPEQLSATARTSYDQGRFDVAIDCWQRAAVAYRQAGNETESINNLINQAQAEQALGLYPRACNTLAKIYTQQDCPSLLQDEKKRPIFFATLEQKANSPAKIAGLHSFGNVLREIGELDLSHQVLLVSLKLTQPQEQASVWLDLGNTRRALSNQEQDLYNRSQELQNIVCASVNNYAADDAYQKAVNHYDSTLESNSLLTLQANLNQLSLLLDLQDWRNQIIDQTDKNDDTLLQLFGPNIFSSAKESTLKIIVGTCWKKLNLANAQDTTFEKELSAQEIANWVFERILSQNPSIQSQAIIDLQQNIEQLPPSYTTLYTRLNFSQNLMRLRDVSSSSQRIEQFLNTTINQAKNTGNIRVESYALGYLGKLYEQTQQWESAKTRTQQALLLAQSIPSPDMTYQWQWQLGRIYKSEHSANEQTQIKQLPQDLTAARSAYEGAFQTIESLRRELATDNPDVQFYFQNNIETIYREYVDLLLREPEPNSQNLSKAREVIASLQAVELENFLRLACPEYNVQQIDQIIDQQTQKTAFLYPILLEDRVEVVIKLPNNVTNKQAAKQSLKHYRTLISRSEVEKQIRQFQLDLEEDYTFDAVQREGREIYKWLLQGAEPYLSQNIETLVFALDTNLRNIPLAALVYDIKSGTPQYLIDKYAIALAPRLQIPTPKVLVNKLDVLAAGLKEPELVEYQTFPKLRYVEEELAAIKNANPAQISVAQLIDKQFKLNQFKDKINTSTFQVVHLATHGEFSSSPEKTFILASDTPIVVNELGKLFRKQAQNQLEPIELLVLSACETAAGDKRATLGISGVGVQAGARSAIASLWALDDQISVKFSQNLYKRLVDPNLTKAQALQQAQISLKSSPGREHPRYWAPYILLGNWL